MSRTGWTNGTKRGVGRNSNIEYRILNGEAEIGGVLRGGRFNRFLDKLGMTRGGDIDGDGEITVLDLDHILHGGNARINWA